MTYLHYDLELSSPAIVSTLSGDPNSAATQKFIPGSAVRGALAARLIAAGEDGESEVFRRLILSGAVRFLHAYPLVAGSRPLPVPLSWKSLKDKPQKGIDLAEFSGALTDHDFGKAWPESALSSVRGTFVAPSGPTGSRLLDNVKLSSRVHQQRDRVKGRPWKDQQETIHGAIFAYEYLKECQTFAGVIQVTDAASCDVSRIKELLSKPLLVGRSRRAGYGGEARVSWQIDGEREYPAVMGRIGANVKAGTRFSVLLTSAYIGRHPQTGQIDPAALELELAEALGGAVSIQRRRWAFETLGGFNRKWGLETPQVIAVRGGSVLVLQANQEIALKQLQAIEDHGLGERRVEGFGRCIFIEHSSQSSVFSLETESKSILPEVPMALSSAQNSQLTLLETRLVLNAARAELDCVARLDLVQDEAQLPTNSLLGRLRTPLRASLDETTALQALETLATWCDDGNGANRLKDNARRQLSECKISVGRGKCSLLDWLASIASVKVGQTGWTTLLAATGNQTSVTALATRNHLTSVEVAQGILEANAAMLRGYLVDAVLAAMSQKNRRGEA